MTDVVITAAKRTPVGAFLGGFARRPAHELGRDRDRGGARAGRRRAGRSVRSHPRPGAHRRPGPEPGAPGVDGRRHPEGSARLGRQPGLRLGPARGRARACRRSRPATPSIVVAGGQESMSLSPHCAHLRGGTKMGDARAGRHDDQGRAHRRLQRLSHGHHRREPRRASIRSPARSRTRSPPPRRTRPRRREGRPLQGRDRAGHGQDPQGRDDRRHRRIYPRTAPRSRRWPSCARPSRRTAPSPPPTPRASTTAPPRSC